MNRIVLLVATLLLAWPIAGIGAAGAVGTDTAAGAADTVTLPVSVTDVDGEPVPGAEVTVSYDDQQNTKTTHSNGQAFFDVPTGADVSIQAAHDDLVRNLPRTVENVSEHADATVVLHPSAGTTATVTAGGDPVEGATVALRKEGQSEPAVEATTGDDGTVSVSGLEEGAYEVTAVKSGYLSANATADLTADDADVALELEEGTAAVTFTIVDRNFDEPRPLRADVTVRQDGDRVATITTNDRGERGIALDVNTEYEVVVEKEGYDRQRRGLTVREADRGVEYGIDRVDSLEVSPRYGEVLVGQDVAVVVTDEYDRPVEGATVLVDGESRATTGGDGTASVAVETAGDLSFTAEADGVTSDPVTVEGIPRSEGTDTDAGTDADTDAETDTDTGTDATTETTADDDDGAGEQAVEDDSVPGFSPLAALAAVAALLAGLLARRR